MEATPNLDLYVVGSPTGAVISARVVRPLLIEMREPHITLLRGKSSTIVNAEWVRELVGDHESLVLPAPLRIDLEEPTALTIVWRGEVWPKYSCYVLGGASVRAVESLGNKMMVRLGGEL